MSYCSLPAGEFLLQEREILSLISHALRGKARIRPPSGRGSVASRKSPLAFAVDHVHARLELPLAVCVGLLL